MGSGSGVDGSGGYLSHHTSFLPSLEPQPFDMGSWNYHDVLLPQPSEPWHTVVPQTIPVAGGSANTAVVQTPDWTSPSSNGLDHAFPEISELALSLDQGIDASNSQWIEPSPCVSTSASPSTGSSSDTGSFGSTMPRNAVQKRPHGNKASGCSNHTSTAKQHKRHQSKRWQCPIDGCHKRFSLRLDLERHLRTVKHGGKRTIQCTWCVKGFTRKDNYKRHLETAHGGG